MDAILTTMVLLKNGSKERGNHNLHLPDTKREFVFDQRRRNLFAAWIATLEKSSAVGVIVDRKFQTILR